MEVSTSLVGPDQGWLSQKWCYPHAGLTAVRLALCLLVFSNLVLADRIAAALSGQSIS